MICDKGPRKCRWTDTHAIPTGENERKKKWEGRKVGIDFFRSAKGPPDDLRKEKDEFNGRFGLATEFAGWIERWRQRCSEGMR